MENVKSAVPSRLEAQAATIKQQESNRVISSPRPPSDKRGESLMSGTSKNNENGFKYKEKIEIEE